MSRNGAGPREVAVPVMVFDALRTELAKEAGTLQTVRALHHAGYQSGLAAAGGVNQDAGGDSFALSETGFWSNFSDYFSRRGWGTLAHRTAHPAVGILRTTDWAESSPDAVEPRMVLSMPEVLSAVTETLPPIAVLLSPISLSAILAWVSLCTRLVAMVALTAREVPVPKALPPEDETWLNMVAAICAFDSAATLTSPPAATSLLSI